jgi:hypothetical protein
MTVKWSSLCDSVLRATVIPVCFNGSMFSRDNMTAIIVRVKDNKGERFNCMDPFAVGLFSKRVTQRYWSLGWVFALDIWDLPYVSEWTSSLSRRLFYFAAYDIWCA